jgi:transposase InsO family protein
VVPIGPPSPRFSERKPDWVELAVLRLAEQTGQSHRQLATTFNRLHFARTGVSVGRTWVRELLKRQAYRELHARQQCKHRVPSALPNNTEWGFDTTNLRDSTANGHIVLGLVDHGSRLNLMLRAIPRFNAWTLLGYLFLAIGRYGRPSVIRFDNHPVHRAKKVTAVLRWAGIRPRFIRPASPWQNGRIERFFGTLKSHLGKMRFAEAGQLELGLAVFRVYYNHVRGHQHLGGRTPSEAWRGLDPYQRAPRRLIWYEGWGGRLRGWQLQH